MIAFVETAGLWWLYFGAAADRARTAVGASVDPGRIARNAYTNVHLPIVAGIIGVAAGNELLLAEPHGALHGTALAAALGGPSLFLVAESAFQWMTAGEASIKRLAAAGLILALAPLAPQVSVLALCALVTAVLTALALWEVRSPPAPAPLPAAH